MTSMRRLRRRLLRWQRYAHRTYWSPRSTRPAWMGPNVAIARGHRRAWDAVQLEDERRRCRPIRVTIHLPEELLADRDPDICWCDDDCTCGWDEYDEDLADHHWPPYVGLSPRRVETITVAGGVL